MGLALHTELSALTGRLRLELTEAGEARFVWHGRNTYSCNRLFLTEAGEGTIFNRTSGQHLAMRAGNFCFMPPGIDLEFDFPAGLRFYSFHFTIELLPGIDLFTGIRQCRSWEASPGTAAELARIYAETPGWSRAFRFTGWLWTALSEAAGELPASIPVSVYHSTTYRKLFDFVRLHGSAATTVTELSRASGINYDRLSREFRRDFGITLKEFLTGELRRRAELLLADGTLSIKEVAAHLEFRSEFYFSRFFHRTTGMSPRNWREAHNLLHKKILRPGS